MACDHGCHPLGCQCCCYTAPMRHVVVVMLLFLVVTAYAQRVCFNIVIVEMTEESGQTVSECPLPEGEKEATIKNIGGGKYAWDETAQAILLAFFYLGYIPVHFPVGWLCDKYGARWPVIVGMIVSTVCTFLMPIVVKNMHYGFVAALRFTAGAGQAVVYPGISSYLSRWIPAYERATMGGVVFAGNSIGVIIGTLVTGLVINQWKDWTIIFYMWGIVGVVFLIFFSLYVFSTPQTHPSIGLAELVKIEAFVTKKEKFKTPYWQIIKDPAIFGLVVGQIGHNYVFFTIITNLPKYMNNVLRYNMKSNAVASSIPHACGYVASIITGKIADYWLQSRNGNINLVRKLYSFISFVGAGVCCVIASYMDCERIPALSFFSLALVFKGMFYCSMKVNPMDLSDHHASFLMGYTNGIGALSAFITPYIIGALAKDNTLAQWHIVFLIVLTVATISVLTFCIFGTAKRRKWDYTAADLEKLEQTKNDPKPKVKWYLQKTPEAFIADKQKKKEELLELKKKADTDTAKLVAEDKEAKRLAKEKKQEEKAKKKAGG